MTLLKYNNILCFQIEFRFPNTSHNQELKKLGNRVFKEITSNIMICDRG